MNSPSYIINTNSNEDKRRFNAVCASLSKRGHKQEEINQAVTATALAGDRPAAAWLCNHSRDPSLGGANPREFYLHLCPIGGLEASFQEFWSRYRAARGWCASMDYTPHATIVEPFEVPPGAYLDLLRAYNTAARLFANRRLVKRLRLLPSNFNDNHLGFAIDAEQALLELAREFAAACDRVGIPVAVRQPPHRLSLCCGFQQAQYLQVQKEITEHFRINPDTRVVLPDSLDAASTASASGVWQLRLYSRDVRLNDGMTNQLYPLYRLACERPMSEDVTATPEDLHYSSGDRVALVAKVSPPRHGWGLGFNVETGVMGNFPLLWAHRIPCFEAWTLHRVTPMQCEVGFVGISPLPEQEPQTKALAVPAVRSSGHATATSSASSSSSSSATAASGNEATPTQSAGLGLVSNGGSAAGAAAAALAPAAQQVYRGGSSNGSGSCSGDSFEMAPLSPASGISSSSGFPFSPLMESAPAFSFDYQLQRLSLASASDASSSSAGMQRPRQRRQVHVMRHAEPLDDALGPDWPTAALDESGRLVDRYDLSIPALLPIRPPVEFGADPPLSLIGQFMSSQMGLSLGRSGVRYTQCYSSPTLACVQSAHYTLGGVGQADLLIRLEPMLADNTETAVSGAAADSATPASNRVFLSCNSLREFGYNVDASYSPLIAADSLNGAAAESYKDRLAKVLKRALDSCKIAGGKILIVGHRTTVQNSLAALATLTNRGGGAGSGRCGSGGSSSVSSGGSGAAPGPHGAAATAATAAAAAASAVNLYRRTPSVPYAALHCIEERASGRRGWASAAGPVATVFSVQSHSPFDAAALIPSS